MKSTTKWLLTLLLVSVAGSFPIYAQGAQPWDENRITWAAPTTCTSGQPVANCAVTGYRVEESATATGTYRVLATVTGTSYTHAGVSAGQHCYRAVALSAKGDSIPSNVACKTNTQPSGPPNPPTNLTIVEPIAYNVRPDYGRFAFVRGARAGFAKIGASCDESRVTADGYMAISRPRAVVTPRPTEGTVLVARCGTRKA